MILSLEKPKKIRSTETHNSMHSSDSGVAGTYAPNMSRADMERWKGKLISGEDRRVEIRKSVGGVQVLIIVRPDKTVRISMNGPAVMDKKTFRDFHTVVDEAYELLGKRKVGD